MADKKFLTLDDLPIVSRFAIPKELLQAYLQFAVVGDVHHVGVNDKNEHVYINRHGDLFYSPVLLEQGG